MILSLHSAHNNSTPSCVCVCVCSLSGLSPFMGDTDADTLQNVIEGDYDFDYPEFEEISADAKDLVAKLLVKDKMWGTTANANNWQIYRKDSF